MLLILARRIFSLNEIVLDHHDELKVSQLSLLLSSGRAGNEIGLAGVSQVRSARAGLIHHLHTHTCTYTMQAQKAVRLS